MAAEQNNVTIKNLMKKHKITQYQLAKALLVSENTVYRALRDELSKEKFDLYTQALNVIIEGRNKK